MVTADAAFEQNNSSIFKQEAVQSRFAETLFRHLEKVHNMSKRRYFVEKNRTVFNYIFSPNFLLL